MPDRPDRPILERIAKVLSRHRASEIRQVCICGQAPGYLTLGEHQADELVRELGLSQERRVMTPQGTSRPVGEHEQLGERLRSLGWWIESRWLIDWTRDDA